MIVALGVERECVGRTGPRVVLVQSGPGEARAAAAAGTALAAGVRALVSFGLAGGLAADVRPGRLLLPREVVTPDARRFAVDPHWHARLAGALASTTVDDRPLLAAAGVVASADEKRRAAALGAAGADLESGAIAAAAARAGVPFAVIRAVADGPGDDLPADVSAWVGADGETRLARVLVAALRPRNWLPLVTLARRYAAARRSLAGAARRIVQEDFLFA
ncbi:MAG TPA: hypothetical protein VF322_02405 [Gammaproteobacteria bacterium]